MTTETRWLDALDGNAIAGLLLDVFGNEMTMANGTCATCGARSLLAEIAVYTRAPGTVARCRSCGNTLMVFTERRGLVCVDLLGLAALEPAG
jgi:uncharacterized protein DUF6510